MSVKARVRCAGISYVTREPLLDAEGEQVTNDSGVKQFSIIRQEALLGQEIELSEHEFEIHERLGGVQRADDDTPLPGAPGSRVRATPFTIPNHDGEIEPYLAPVMGDPRPAGAGLSDTELLHGGAGRPLTAEQVEEYQKMAAGETGNKEVTELDVSTASVDEIREFIDDNKLGVDDTVDLAGDDPEYAAKVREAEEAGKSRVRAIERLDKIANREEQ